MIIGGGCIIISGGKVLLMKRKNVKFFNNQWSNPGGKIEEGETIKNGIVREAKEELGIIISLKKNLGVYKWKIEEAEEEFSGYEAEITEGEPKIMELHKCEALEWFDINNLPHPLAPYTAYYLKNLGY
ncbi:NUDIX domain-containing protein [Candidatus Pacearchaeota archaeon]|nr:NUDIX domain-containing protein [Candidatus Pacearchaeota archaeon]